MISPPRCYVRRCIHYIGIKTLVEGDEETQVPVCKAFPDAGIPEDIAYGVDPHTEVHIFQDNTIVYERKK
jgi:hypothetical protein